MFLQESHAVFVNHGALAGIMQLSGRGVPLVQELCAHTVYNLSFDAKAREALVSELVRCSIVAPRERSFQCI